MTLRRASKSPVRSDAQKGGGED